MTTAISLTFPWGRYHATPWDRAVNEGVVEWPPSPWRLLRALYATWATRIPDLDGDIVSETLSALAGPPAYRLPASAVAHTRHYYPDTKQGTDKVLDPFVVMHRRAEVLVRWDASLGAGSRSCLGRLCERLPYVGRADSLCDAHLVPEDALLSDDGWIVPGETGDLLEPGVTVLAAQLPLDLDALTVRTTTVRRGGHLIPPGSRYVRYQVPTSVPPPSIPHRQLLSDRWEVGLLLLDAPVLPSIHDGVWVGHVARQAAIRAFDVVGRKQSSSGGKSAVLAGKDASDVRLEGHRHAHYLPLDRDGDRLLDAVAVWAPDGLDERELAALGSIRRLWSPHPDFRPVRVSLTARGNPSALLPSLTAPSSVWESVTPFVPYRHRKREPLEEFLLDALGREAAARVLPRPALVRIVKGSWLEFRRSRPGERDERQGFGVVISFPQPVEGPLAFGALSHFGLGQFQPRP